LKLILMDRLLQMMPTAMIRASPLLICRHGSARPRA
jgi:hypothetical protein